MGNSPKKSNCLARLVMFLQQVRTALRGTRGAVPAMRRPSATTELRPRGHRRRRALVLMAEVDPAFRKIVRSHLDGDPVAGEDADTVFLHPARRIRERLVPIVETHAKTSIGK